MGNMGVFGPQAYILLIFAHKSFGCHGHQMLVGAQCHFTSLKPQLHTLFYSRVKVLLHYIEGCDPLESSFAFTILIFTSELKGSSSHDNYILTFLN